MNKRAENLDDLSAEIEKALVSPSEARLLLSLLRRRSRLIRQLEPLSRETTERLRAQNNRWVERSHELLDILRQDLATARKRKEKRQALQDAYRNTEQIARLFQDRC